jgi:hypothetical protein
MDLEAALQGEEKSLFQASNALENCAPDLCPFLMYFKDELTPGLRGDFLGLLDGLAGGYGKLRKRYQSDLAYGAEENAPRLDSLVRHDYLVIHSQMETSLAALATNHKSEVLRLIVQGRKLFPPLAEKSRARHGHDLRQVGLEETAPNYRDQISPYEGWEELHAVVREYGYPELIRLAHILEAAWREATPGKASKTYHPTRGSDSASRIMLGFSELVILSMAFDIEVPEDYPGNWIDMIFIRGKRAVTMSLKCPGDTAAVFNKYRRGEALDWRDRGAPDKLATIGALLWDMRAKGKLPELAAAKKTGKKK